MEQRHDLNLTDQPDRRGQTQPYDVNGAPVGGSVAWGAITGTLSDQADLAAALAAASGGYTVASHAASYAETATGGELVVKITASGQTVTLPTAVGNTAKLTFKLMVAGTLTLDGAGAQTIDGGLTATLSSQYESITLVSDNANWIVI